MRGYVLGNRRLLIVKKNGVVKALDDWCNHGGCLLSGGALEGNMVVCGCHEIGFDLDTGRNMTSPGIAGDQQTFRAEVTGGEIYLIEEG